MSDDVLSWESAIYDDEDTQRQSKPSPWRVIEPGEYRFTVHELKQERYEGSDKMPACPMARVTLSIEHPDGECYIEERFYLLKKYMWKLVSFFESIGVMKPGSKMFMDWLHVTGKSGVVMISNREYKGRKYNNVYMFFRPDHVSEKPLYVADYPLSAPVDKPETNAASRSAVPDDTIPF